MQPIKQGSIPGRICLLCKHFHMDTGWGGSDVTPGDPPEMECMKEHWNLNGRWEDADNLRKCMRKAEDCKDYIHHKEDESCNR